MTESKIRDEGPEPMLVEENIGRYWIAYEFDMEATAKHVWEEIMQNTKYLSAWRVRSPLVPPHLHESVYVMGETRSEIEKAEKICMDSGGRWIEPESGMVHSLRLRRQELAIERIMKGAPPGKTQHRDPKGWTLDRLGRRHPR